jgi:hypothetical protein
MRCSNAAYHVLAALQQIFAPIPTHSTTGVDSSKKISLEEAPALIAVLTYVTHLKLSGLATDEEGYGKWRRKSQVAWAKLARSLELLSAEDMDAVTEEDLLPLSAVDQARTFVETEWVGSEWYVNIPVFGGAGATTTEGDEGEIEEGLSKGNGSKRAKLQRRTESDFAGEASTFQEEVGEVDEVGLWPGLGTMMQPRVDFLSAAYTRSYEAWRAKVMLEMQAMETLGRVGN